MTHRSTSATGVQSAINGSLSGPRAVSTPATTTSRPRRSWFAVLRRAVKQIQPDELTDRAAALTYYGVQAIFPGVLVLVSVLGLLGRSAANSLISNLGDIAPGTVQSFIRTVIHNAQQQKVAAGL